MKSYFVLFFQLCLTLYSLGQNPTLPGQYYTEESIFKKEDIIKFQVQKITAEYAYKYDMKPIVEEHKRVIYYFNEAGLIRHKKEITSHRKRVDSNSYDFTYDKKGNLLTCVFRETKFQNITVANYSAHNTYNLSFYLIPANLPWQKHLSKDHLVWQDSIKKSGNRMTYFNQYGHEYKYTAFEKLDSSNTEIITEYLKGGKLNNKLIYYFNKDQQVIEIESLNLNPHLFDWTKKYTYNQGRLSEEKYFKEGALKWKRRISYFENGLPELDITRDEQTKKMTIVKFVY